MSLKRATRFMAAREVQSIEYGYKKHHAQIQVLFEDLSGFIRNASIGSVILCNSPG